MSKRYINAVDSVSKGNTIKEIQEKKKKTISIFCYRFHDTK